MLVYTLVAVPVVAAANNGYKLVEVLVSLLMEEPPTEDQAVPLCPSNSLVLVLKRNLPAAPVGRSAVVPVESFTAPVELKLESAEAVMLVKAPVLAVVAPTVPLMLMEAVPVRFVTTPLAGVPNAGVTNVGEFANTRAPVPVSSDTAAAKLADDGVPKKVATPVASPLIPVATGRPVAFVKVTDDGVPSAGVTNVGLLANTKAPVPVSSDTAAAKLADDGVPKNVATPVPKPETPVLIGRPVAFVSVAADGVPRAGAVSYTHLTLPTILLV